MPSRKIAIGPQCDRPTWSWVGFNLARELSRDFEISIFRPGEHPGAGLVINIKEPFPFDLTGPSECTVVHLPFDFYETREQLELDPYLRRYAGLAVHSHALLRICSELHPRVKFLMHDDKYLSPEMAVPKPDGPVLWIGLSKYIPFLREWARASDFHAPLLILTDKPEAEELPACCVECRLWSPVEQYRALHESRAGIDIKGGDFGQSTKPLEKLHIYIASGLPAAANRQPEITDSFRTLGFELADAADTELLFSPDYAARSREFGLRLRRMMDLSSIGTELRRFLAEISE